MAKFRNLFTLLPILFTAILACGQVKAQESTALADPTTAQLEFFEKEIRPALIEHCYECHSSKSKPAKGGLSLETREAARRGGDSGPAVIPGKVDESLLLSAIRYEDFEMPPKGKLPASVIQKFERWIEMGAPDPRRQNSTSVAKGIDYDKGLKFWAFQTPRRRPPPTTRNKHWPKGPIDQFVLAQLEAANITPSAPAERRVLIRRAYFGVIGLPPTPEEVESFIRDDSAEAFANVVERLLNSKHYGERWGRHWLDVARYGEDQAHTFKARRYPLGYRYRDWVVSALNADLPYDDFLKYQIAADLLDDPKRHERLPALGVFALGPVYYQDNGEKAKALADEWDDRVDTLMRGVLGLTVACARCHDHKYDPLSMEDYYGLAGIFAASKYEERPIVAPSVLREKSVAESAVKEHELKLNRFLAEQARRVRPQLVELIPEFVVAAWKLENLFKGSNAKKDKKKLDKLAKKLAASSKLSPTLLGRWREYLFDPSANDAPRPELEAWREWLAKQSMSENLSEDKRLLADARQFGEQWKSRIEGLASRRESLLKRFGANLAFVDEADRAQVQPGWIPLGNLFDDPQGASLENALSSDKYNAAADPNDLGVERVSQGWGETLEIAPGIRVDLRKLGSDGSKFGQILNDGWGGGALSTQGRSQRGKQRREQGVGMHANAAITFNLDEIRRAGLLPIDQKFVFVSERAGLNDDVFGSKSPSAHLAVFVSRPNKDQSTYDAILSAHVNGQPMSAVENDTLYYLAGKAPPALKADGKFSRFEVLVPAEAKYLTLIATGAASGADGNTINSDHTVFGGARLELDPPTKKNGIELADTSDQASSKERSEKQNRADARILSRYFYDAGLLGVPAGEAERWFGESTQTQVGQLRDALEGLKKHSAGIEVLKAHALSDGASADLKVYLQGNPAKQGRLAPRSFPAIFTSGKRAPFNPQGSGRLELAHAVADPKNPLTARVMVNRIWQGHFGFGLVRTPSNFGSLGERPSHPELLDYLAIQLIESGWSLKSIHRQILLSATYQQSAGYRPKLAAVDPENRLLWRMNRRRLEVEPWRDSMLAVTGKLDTMMGGPSKDLDDANNRRRTLYGFVSRHRLNELLRLFDFPDPNITSDQRTVTTVPLQQLFVLNSEFMLRQAKALSERLAKEGGGDSDRIKRAFALLYGRAPSQTELQTGLDFLQSVAAEKREGDRLDAWQQYGLVLLGANEFAYID